MTENLLKRVRAYALLLVMPVAALACDPHLPAEAPSAPSATQTDLPWPVPLPSTSMEVPQALRAPAEPGGHLTRPANWLSRALGEAGYSDFRWYDIPNGFALVTRLELIDDQGQANAHPDPAVRFSVEYPQVGFFTMRFWAELLPKKTGRYRCFVFIVVDNPFGYAKDVTDSQIVWKKPSRELPLNRADLTYSAGDKWYALVYEIERVGENGHASLVQTPSDPLAHMTKSGIFAALDHVAKTDAQKTAAQAPVPVAPASSGAAVP